MIKFLDLQTINKAPFERFTKKLTQFQLDGTYIGGDVLAQFEKGFAAFCGKSHFVGMGNGYDALLASLSILNLQPDDEVIVPAHTFIATWLAVTNSGAKLVPVDVCNQTYLAKKSDILNAINKRTKAIIVVDLYGMPYDLLDLRTSIPENIIIINDAAQAHGSKYQQHSVGCHADMTCWSFYPGKTLGAIGDGGGVSTNNADYAQKLRAFANYGSTTKYCHDVKGVNSRLDPIQALFLNEKLKDLAAEVDYRNKLATMYQKGLDQDKYILPMLHSEYTHGQHLYVIRVPNRNEILKKLSQNAIEYGIHYPTPCFLQKSYRLHFQGQSFENSMQISQEVISLPIGSHITTDQIDKIIDTLNS